MTRFTWVWIMLLCLQTFGMVVSGQNNSVILEEQFQNTPLPEVLKLLKDKYQIQLAYDNEAVQDVVVNESLEKLDLDQALSKIFSGTDLNYWVTDKKQVLIQRVQNYSFSPPPEEAQFIEITGQILDAQTGEPLPFATVHSVPGDKNGVADEFGYFQLEVVDEPGSSIGCRYLGYETKFVPVGQSKKIDIDLSPQIHLIEAVVISDAPTALSNGSSSDNASIYRATQLTALPSFAGGPDLFRNLQLLPGIAAFDDLSANLKVRGSNGDENMVRLDGITLYNVNHFYGIFSNINGNLVDEVRIYKNAFPVEFGGRTASVIDITTKENAQQKISGGAELNFLTTNAQLNLPLSKNMSLLLGGRTTNSNLTNTKLFDLLEQQNNTDIQFLRNQSSISNPEFVKLEPDFSFYDANAKWNWQIDPSLEVQASFFRGSDNLQYQYEEDFEHKIGGKLRQFTGKFIQTSDWINKGWSAGLKKDWTDHFQTQLNFSSSSYQIKDSSFFQLITPREPINAFNNSRTNTISGKELNLKNTYSISPGSSFSFGYQLTKNEVNFKVLLEDSILVNNAETGMQHALFAEYHGSGMDNKLQYVIGIRGTNYSITEKNYFSPRLQASYQIDDNWKIKGAWSRYNQFLRQSYHEDIYGRSFEFWALANDKKRRNPRAQNYPVAASNHVMVGFNFINEWFSLDVEAYQKRTEGVFEQALTLIGFEQASTAPPRIKNRFFRVLEGEGLTRGIDLLLKKDSDFYTGWLAYTLSKTTQAYPEINQGKPFPSQDDRRHQLNLVNIFKHKDWEFSATYIFASGRPYTNLGIFADGLKNRSDIPIENRLATLEDYYRMDLGVNYNFKLGKAQAKAGFSIFNLFDRTNVKYRQYILSIGESEDANGPLKNTVIGSEIQMLGRTPNLSFSINF